MYKLTKITFGELTEVKGLSHDYDGILDPGVDTERINLVLSENQKVMTKTGKEMNIFGLRQKNIIKGALSMASHRFSNINSNP